MSTDNDPGAGDGGLGVRLAAFANWFNETVVGSPWTYLFCIATVVFVYLLIPLQGYSKWNLTSGLFFNTTSSSVELITGVGAVVGVYAVRRAQHQHEKALARHARSVEDLHGKIDGLIAARAADAQVSGGAGSNPAESRLPADERMAAPPAVSRKLQDPKAGRRPAGGT